MIVDDNIFNILALETILSNKNVGLTERALNGQEAVNLVQKRLDYYKSKPCTCTGRSTHRADYQLIFMDCNMPVMDGFEATRRILQMSPTAKIVTLTAYSTEEFRSKCQEAGMLEFLTKPINEEKLSQLLLDVGLAKV